MTLPDRLTTVRLVLSPIFFALFFLPRWTGAAPVWIVILLWIVWGLIELSDVLDGYTARRLGAGSEFGKLFDPFADVVGRLTFFLCFTVSGIMPVWIFIILLYRELGMTFLRVVSFSKGRVVGAKFPGKLKAVFYSLSAAAGLLLFTFPRLPFRQTSPPAILSAAVFYLFILSAGASVLSFGLYLNALFRKRDDGNETG